MWMDNWVLNMPVSLWPTYGAGKIPLLFRFFESQSTVVVLANSNQADKETNLEACQKINVPILKRKGGGGTVVLGPGCLILTFAFYAKDIFGNKEYFKKINQLWINALKEVGIQNLSENGISDICCGDKKVAGTSIFRKKHLLVYQGSMLIDPDLKLISQLLAHPSKEPDYRAGRTHHDFLTTLKDLGYQGNATELAQHCQTYFESHAGEMFVTDAVMIV
jgi:lipoate-protein ligase A